MLDEKLIYFSIGFKSENSVQAFKNYKTKPNKFLIQNAYSIIKRFDRIISEKGLFNLSLDDEGMYLNLLLGDPEKKEILEELALKIKPTKVALEKMIAKKEISDEELKTGISFFKEISAKCLQEGAVKNYF